MMIIIIIIMASREQQKQKRVKKKKIEEEQTEYLPVLYGLLMWGAINTTIFSMLMSLPAVIFVWFRAFCRL